MYAVCPGVLYGCAYRIILCSSLVSVVVLVKEEVKTNTLQKSVWCTMMVFVAVLFCSFCLCFVYSLSDWSTVGWDWRAGGGDAPVMLTAAGWANDSTQSGHTPLLLAHCTSKALTSLLGPFLLPVMPLFFKAVGFP